MPRQSNTLLEIDALSVEFATERGVVRAVNHVSYTLANGETLGVVGESGSGKSVHALAILGVLPRAGTRVQGSIRYEGRELLDQPEPAMRDLRGNRIAMIFQDPMTSLHPMLTIGVQIAESLTRHKGMGGRAAWRRAVELLDLVHISEPEHRVGQFPGELSGGMRQRVMIAMALACEPQLLIADEPTTALDVTVQAEIIALVKDLRRRFGMALIWITHDLGVVAGLADTINVMYAGQVVECGPVDDIFADPRHAYTLGLLQSLPQTVSPRERLPQMAGGPPDLSALRAGDPFAPRNPFATERCWRECPPLAQADGAAPGHRVAAWYDLRQADRRAGRTNV